MRPAPHLVLLASAAACGLVQPAPPAEPLTTTLEGPPRPDTSDTALVLLGYTGVAEVDSGLEGTETFTAIRRRDAETLCSWTWRTVSWGRDSEATGPDPITVPCNDPSGQPCRFAFTVSLRDGLPDPDIDATACAAFREVAPLVPDAGPFGYGFVDAYTEVPGGPSYGPALMFHVEAAAPEEPYWVGYGLQGAFDGSTFEYHFDLGALPY